jgi:hypothetical protein
MELRHFVIVVVIIVNDYGMPTDVHRKNKSWCLASFARVSRFSLAGLDAMQHIQLDTTMIVNGVPMVDWVPKLTLHIKIRLFDVV